MTEKERNEKWTKDAMAHKNWEGKPVGQVVTKELPSLPKDENGQVIIPFNVAEERLTVVKSVQKRVNPVSPFVNAPVVNALSGF